MQTVPRWLCIPDRDYINSLRRWLDWWFPSKAPCVRTTPVAFARNFFCGQRIRTSALCVMIDTARRTIIMIYTWFLYSWGEIPVAKYVNDVCNGVLTDTISLLDKTETSAKTNLLQWYILWISRFWKCFRVELNCRAHASGMANSFLTASLKVSVSN